MDHSRSEYARLLRAIVEDFAPRFVPGNMLIYCGDTDEQPAFFDASLLVKLGIDVRALGKMPDVVLHFLERDWLLLIDSVTSPAPIDGERHTDLTKRFATSKAELVYVTAFPNRLAMSKHLVEITWQTAVWLADAPEHLIHFNGSCLLGPYDKK